MPFDYYTPNMDDADRTVRSSSHHEQELDEQVEYENPSKEDLDRLSDRLGDHNDPLDFGEARRPQRYVNPLDGDFVSPVKRLQARRRTLLPNYDEIRRLEERLSKPARYAVTEDIDQAVGVARDALEVARSTYREAQDVEGGNSKHARSQQHKDAVVAAIADATRAVAAAEAAFLDNGDDAFDAMVADIGRMQAEAAEALTPAVKKYIAWGRQVGAAHALALDLGYFDKSFHQHPNSQELDRVMAPLSDAEKFARSDDDFLSGRYLESAREPAKEFPAWTIASYAKRAEATSPGSFARQVVARMKQPKGDPDAQSALASKTLLTLLNAPPLGMERPSEQQ